MTYLRSVRRSYLSTAPPPRQSRFAKVQAQHKRRTSREAQDEPQYLTNHQRDSIDAEAKATLREVNGAIKQLTNAEETRQATERALIGQRRRGRGLGVLGRWAAGGVDNERSAQEVEEDGRVADVATCRNSVIWFLQRALEECGRQQSSMMEIRINREVEKEKSILGDFKNPPVMDIPRTNGMSQTLQQEQERQQEHNCEAHEPLESYRRLTEDSCGGARAQRGAATTLCRREQEHAETIRRQKGASQACVAAMLAHARC